MTSYVRHYSNDDCGFKLYVLSQSPNPQSISYLAASNDYAETAKFSTKLTEQKCGELVIKKCLKFGHWGVIEHPSMTLLAAGFPHDTIVQLRTHRLMTFDVQSMRYTGKRFQTEQNFEDIAEDLFYVPQPGLLTTRDGTLDFTEQNRQEAIAACIESAKAYRQQVKYGIPEETARRVLSSGYRQNAVITGNLRAWFHIIALRSPKDAQKECQLFCELLAQALRDWCPEVAGWYLDNNYGKSKLTP